MPTYIYKREDGTTFEVFQKMSDARLEVCPTTGQKVKRVVTGGAGVVYKGEGWYVTDYKNKDKGPSGSSGSGGSAKAPESSSPAKTETAKTE